MFLFVDRLQLKLAGKNSSVVKTDYVIFKQWTRVDEDTSSCNEYPMMVVFVAKLRSLADKKSLLNDIDKYQQTLRAVCIEYGMPRLVAVVSNFRYWHFIQFDL